ncbi:uncharacterized protein LOC126909786 [Daktulosphaira vitifoliae]|uniref:uncharacterized protein LOC126909786 n=1 Tax=Daktulosphaira vitifoliae TaxID=58002 RepID=UPI0021AA4436|nr:uncharacterized protein LOC126909786 [Daktulosphaira vitifoliae]
MAVTMSFGDRVLRNTTISGRKPKPVCMNLPGGVSKFCGRVYGISRDGDQFRACLGLELRALDDVEAALRVSCFRFGPQGMKVEPGQPLPSLAQGEDEDDEDDDEDDDDDDDDDDYGLGAADEEEDDDDDVAEEESENDVDSTGYTGFSALSSDFLSSLFGGGAAAAEEDDVVENVKPSTVKPVTVKTKATTAAYSTSQQTEKQVSVESVTSTSYTVSVVQDSETSTLASLDENPTDRVETIPNSVQVSASTSATTNKKDKDYDDDEDDDDEDDDDIVSDIIDSAADVVGISDTEKNQTTSTGTVTNKTVVTVTEATTAAVASSSVTPAVKGQENDDDDDDETEEDDDDDESFRSLKELTPIAIVPNDRRGRSHRRMRLSSSDPDETAIHFMKKV